jgi:hypothetical protein
MATKVWVGGTGSFNDPTEWSPTGAPGSGDVSIIQIGTAIAQEQKLDGFELQLQSPASVLDISDVQFGAHFTLTVPPGAGGSATLNATGFNANYGLIQMVDTAGPPEFSPPFTINLSDLAPSADCSGAAAVFVNNGTILDESGQPFAIVAKSADAVLINNGLMHLDAPFMSADIGVAVQGTGTIETGHALTPAPSALELASVPFIEFGGTVGSGENLLFDGTAHIQIDKPSQFHALIHGFQPLVSPTPNAYDSFYQPELILAQTQVTSYAVSNDVLSLWNGSALVAQLHFTDYVYTKANFLVTSSGSSTVIEPEGALTPIGAMASRAAVAEHILG